MPRSAGKGPKAWYTGEAYVDSKPVPAGTTVQALVGSTVCGETKTVPPPVHGAELGSLYVLGVSSADDIRGCGRSGVSVTFRVNGRVANEAALWEPRPFDPRRGQVGETLHLVVGAPIVLLGGDILGHEPPANSRIQAFVNGKLCGEAAVLPVEPQGHAWYTMIVRTDIAEPGCAGPGDSIRLKINGQDVIGDADGVPGRHRVDLTVTAPLPVAVIPDIGLNSDSWSRHWLLAIAAIAALSALVGFGLLLRRRASL